MFLNIFVVELKENRSTFLLVSHDGTGQELIVVHSFYFTYPFMPVMISTELQVLSSSAQTDLLAEESGPLLPSVLPAPEVIK